MEIYVNVTYIKTFVLCELWIGQVQNKPALQGNFKKFVLLNHSMHRKLASYFQKMVALLTSYNGFIFKS